MFFLANTLHSKQKLDYLLYHHECRSLRLSGQTITGTAEYLCAAMASASWNYIIVTPSVYFGRRAVF